MSVLAVAKGVKISPRKVAVVASLVRGRTVQDALVILDHAERRSALAVASVIKSAQANAQHNHGYKSEGLVITEITVNHGPRTKRSRPVARGMSHPYMLRTSHIRVLVDGELRASVANKAKTEIKQAAKKESK